jgi:hypothetical protein
MARALENEWIIDEEYRQPLLREMYRIVLSPDSTNREKTRAFEALAKASKKEEVKYAAPEPERNRFLEIAERLGIDVGPTAAIEDRTISSDEATDSEREGRSET